jgi:hypothetical protein
VSSLNNLCKLAKTVIQAVSKYSISGCEFIILESSTANIYFDFRWFGWISDEHERKVEDYSTPMFNNVELGISFLCSRNVRYNVETT